MASQQPTTPASQPVTQPIPVTTPTDTEPAIAPPVAGATKSRKTLADLITERFVKVEDLRKSPVQYNYAWRGVCTKCGWHTHQFDEASARDLVFKHAQQHWRDLALILADQGTEK